MYVSLYYLYVFQPVRSTFLSFLYCYLELALLNDFYTTNQCRVQIRGSQRSGILNFWPMTFDIPFILDFQLYLLHFV